MASMGVRVSLSLPIPFILAARGRLKASG